VPVVPLDEAAASSAIVIVATPSSTFKSLPFHIFGQDQILVDCSNRHKSRGGECSQAEELQRLASDKVTVVKALNVLSAYALNNPSSARQSEVKYQCEDAV